VLDIVDLDVILVNTAPPEFPEILPPANGKNNALASVFVL
jgi:hypothetical protein